MVLATAISTARNKNARGEVFYLLVKAREVL